LTRPNGEFSFENLPLNRKYRLLITGIGYEEVEIDVEFGNSNSKDLGKIFLESDAEILEEITVLGTKPAVQMGIDRKTFNVEKSLVATGGTAIDVIKNIPSVSVDVEGNVQLRNSSPQIFVDGRPTILTLEQIPADHIERIELITNPSARFDASSGGGIINVVLKKNRKLGLNGLISAGAGSPDILTANADLNLREGKFNFFVSGNINNSGGTARSETYRINKQNGTITDYFNQNAKNDRERKTSSLRFGIDFFMDNRNTFSISQGINRNRNGSTETQNQEYFSNLNQLDRIGLRNSSNNSEFDKLTTQFVYKHSFTRPGREISADFTYNQSEGTNHSNITNRYYLGDGTTPTGTINRVRNIGSGDNDQYTFQIDYIDPLSETAKLEAGLRTYLNESLSRFSSYSIAPNNSETLLPLGNNYRFREIVNAGYITYTNAWDKFGCQVGLRVEHSDFTGELLDNGNKFGYTYPGKLSQLWDAMFPSMFLSYSGDEDNIFQLNYTRRIRRPNFRHLNPYIDINDPLNISQGNPALRPEFINSLEFNYSHNYNEGNLLAVIYFRNNPGDITQYSDTISAAQYQQLNNAAIDPGAILNTYINAGYTNSLGAELTLQHKFTDNFDIVPSANFSFRKVKAEVGNLDLSNEGFNWESKLIVNYRVRGVRSKLLKDLNSQLTAEYKSPQVIPQGKRKEEYVIDMAIRKDFLKNKRGSFTFNVNDVFNSRRFGTIYDTDNFYQDGYRRWRVRSFKITLSYKFGDSQFSLFKRRNQNGDMDNPFEDGF
ncbi:MAG TPA: TonB-dependent receptor, partial [Parasegetibacter sp.]